MIFIEILNEYIKSLDELIDAEKRKLSCIEKNDILALEDIMKEEQALSLKLRGIDIKREAYQKENAISHLTFSQIIENTTEDKAELKKYYSDMQARVLDLNRTMDSAKKLIEVHLHTIEDTLSKLNVKTQTSYNVEGKVQKSAFSTTRGRRV